MSALLPHRIRRLHWQARAPTPAAAFSLRSLLRDATDEVLTALERSLSAHIPEDRVLRLPRLTLNVRLPPGARADDLASGIERAVAEALAGQLSAGAPVPGGQGAAGKPMQDAPQPGDALAALQRLPPDALQDLLAQVLADAGTADDAALVLVPLPIPHLPTCRLPLGLVRQLARPGHPAAHAPTTHNTSPACHAQASLDTYLTSGNVDWPLAGLDPETLLQLLRDAALAWVDGDALPHAIARLPPALRPGAVARWLALLPPARRGAALAGRLDAGGALARHPLTPALCDRALASSPATTLLPALWLAWRLEAASPPAALAEFCRSLRARLAQAPAADGQALQAALETAAPADCRAGAASITGTAHDTRPAAPPPFTQRPESAAPSGLLVPAAGLVLAHPYLPRLLDATGLHPAGTRGPLPDPALPAAASLLHWLATGREAEQEFSLPFIKLLLGRAPDTPLPHAPPPLPEAWRVEADALLDAMLAHWQALRGTRPAGLRSGFLQRRGCLEKGDAAWRLRVEPESFDMLLDLLPWGFSLVRLPWMPRPLVTEWPTP